MEDKYPLNPIQRNTFSREGIRMPSRDKTSGTPEIRKKTTTLSASQQNFYTPGGNNPLNDSTSSTEDLILSSLNIAIDETGFISTMKADILQLQEEINKMDLDGKIRNSTTSELLKRNHIYGMLKFLSRYSNQNVKKQIEQKLQHAVSFDTTDLIKFMGVKNEAEGIRKLFRIVGMLDLMLVKLTEYNIIGFLKYDQIFESLRKQFGGGNMDKTAAIDPGISISRFQVILANLEREFELFSYVGKLLQKGSIPKSEEKSNASSPLASIDSIEELYEKLKQGINLGLKGEVSLSLLSLIEATSQSKQKDSDALKKIQKLEKELKDKTSALQQLEKELKERDNYYQQQEINMKTKVQELQHLLDSKEDQLEKELEKQRADLLKVKNSDSSSREKEYLNQISTMEKSIKDFKLEIHKLRENEGKLNQQLKNIKEEASHQPKESSTSGSDYYAVLLQQIEENFKDKVLKLEEQNMKFSNEIVDLNAKLEAFDVEKEELLRKIKDYQQQHELELRARLKGDDTFESALREQFNNMKQAFEDKIKMLNENNQVLKKEKGREIVELKTQLTRERENRELLLRKLQKMSYKRNKLHLNENIDIELDSDVFGPTTFEEIDRKFRQFSNHLSKGRDEGQIQTRRSSIKNKGSPRGLSSKKKVGWTTNNTDLDDKGDTLLSETEPRNDNAKPLKTGITKKLTRANSSVGWNLYDEKTLQLSKEFGISLAVLSNFETQHEKEQYILQCIRKSLNADFQEFNKKHNAKISQMKNFEKDFIKDKLKMEDDKADIFKWLNVKTPFDPLKKKLRSRLVETITDYENQTQIEKSLDEIKKSREGSLYNSTMKVTLGNAPTINNTEILMDDLGHNSQGLFKIMKPTKHNKTQSMSVMSTVNHSQIPSPHSTNTFNNVNSFKPSQFNVNTITTNTDDEEKQIENALKQGYRWNREKESVFQGHRESAKSRLFDQVKSSSWNEVGFSPLVQASQMDEKSKLQRDTKLAKYMNGDCLSPEEYKFLASTSRSLNECIDKKFLQVAVNYLDPEVIEAIEVDLAQNILHDYQKVRQQIKEARLEFLKESNKSKIDVVQKNHINFQRTLKVLHGAEEQKRTKIKVINFLNEYQKRRLLKSLERNQSTKSAGVDLGHFAKKFMKPIEEKVHHRKIKENENFLRTVVHVASTPKEKMIDVKQTRHYFHPPSKIVVDAEKHVRDFMGLGASLQDPLIAQRNNDPPQMFHLNINSPPALKVPENFRRFYSGGPNDNEQELFQGNYIVGDVSQYKITKFEESVLVKLQSLWRGCKQREAFKYVKDQASERIRIQQRMEYLKHKSDSAFLRTVLLAKERIQLSTEEHEEAKDKISIDKFDKLFERQQSIMSPTASDKDGAVSLTNFDRYGGASPKIVGALKGAFDRILSGQPASSQNFSNNSQPAINTLNTLDHSQEGRKVDRKKLSPRLISPSSVKNLHKTSFKISRPQTATNRDKGTFMFPSSQTKSNLQKVSNSNNRPVSGHYNTVSPSRPLTANNIQNKFDEGKKNEGQPEKILKVEKKVPHQGLLLKQRKLFTAAKSNSMASILSSGFNYFEADVNVKDEHGNTPLLYAARTGNKEICEFLIDHKARINDPCSEGNTPLHMAFASGQVMLVILMISKGGNLNVLNDHGQTPVAFGSESLVKLLDLKSAVATYDKKDGARFLPKEFDNNKYLRRFAQNPEDEKGAFQYNSLNRPEIEVTQGETNVQSFIPPIERKTGRHMLLEQ